MTKKRCPWAEDVEEIYVRYHDEEWGEPTLDDQELFEMLVLESFQARSEEHTSELQSR